MTARRSLRLYARHELSGDHAIALIRVRLILEPGEHFADAVQRLADVIGVNTHGPHSASSMSSVDAYSTKVVSCTSVDHGGQEHPVGLVEIAVPVAAGVQEAGIPLLMAILTYGSVYDFVLEYHLLDVDLPSVLLADLPGPCFDHESWFVGREPGHRLGLIVKPRYSSSRAEIHRYVKPFVEAGVDYVQDDELTVSTEELSLGDRIEAMVGASVRRDGTSVPVIANITGRYGRSLRLARVAQEAGAQGVMVNIVTMGYDALQTIADSPRATVGVVANAIGRSIISGGPSYRVDATVLCKLARASGADAIYTSSFSGQVRNSRDEVARYRHALTGPFEAACQKFASAALMTGGIGVREIVDNHTLYRGPLMLSLGSRVVNLVEAGHTPETILECVRLASTALAEAEDEDDGSARERIEELASRGARQRSCLRDLGVDEMLTRLGGQ